MKSIKWLRSRGRTIERKREEQELGSASLFQRGEEEEEVEEEWRERVSALDRRCGSWSRASMHLVRCSSSRSRCLLRALLSPLPSPPSPRSWAIGNNPPTSSATKPTPRNALKIQRWAKRGSIRGRSTTDKGSLHAATKGWCSGPHYEKSFRTLRHVVKRERFLDADFSSSSGLDLFPSFITATMSPGEIELLRVVRFIPWSRFISRWTNGGTKGGRGCCERLFLFVVYKNKGVVKDEIEVHIYIKSNIYKICDHFVRIVRVIFVIFILEHSVDEIDRKYERLFRRLRINREIVFVEICFSDK